MKCVILNSLVEVPFSWWPAGDEHLRLSAAAFNLLQQLTFGVLLIVLPFILIRRLANFFAFFTHLDLLRLMGYVLNIPWLMHQGHPICCDSKSKICTRLRPDAQCLLCPFLFAAGDLRESWRPLQCPQPSLSLTLVSTHLRVGVPQFEMADIWHYSGGGWVSAWF